jgi:hypothetical protein
MSIQRTKQRAYELLTQKGISYQTAQKYESCMDEMLSRPILWSGQMVDRVTGAYAWDASRYGCPVCIAHTIESAIKMNVSPLVLKTGLVPFLLASIPLAVGVGLPVALIVKVCRKV